MFSIGLILFCMLTIHNKCNAEEEDGDPLFPANNDFLDPSIFSSDSPWSLDPGNLEKQTALQPEYSSNDLTSTFGLLNDDTNDDEIAGGNLPMFADGLEAGCSSGTSQLTSRNTLSRRGTVNNVCDNPNQGGSSSTSGLSTPTAIDPKVAPYIDIGTMELKMICPRGVGVPYSLPVCSSGIRGDIIMRPPKTTYELHWAQKSKFSRPPASHKKKCKNKEGNQSDWIS